MSKNQNIQNNNLDLSAPSDEVIKEARARLWEQGILYWKLGVTQAKIYDFYAQSEEKTIVVNASRRLGKSYYLTIMAVEQCLRYPKSVVKMLQPELKMVRTNIRPIMNEILEDCPEALRPKYNTQDNMYVFANGSEIQLAGTDNQNYEKIRGGQCHLAIVDEAGFCSDLSHIIKFILIPTTLLTGGKIILSSTTPPDPDHEFIKHMEQASTENRLIRKTIFDALEDDRTTMNPRITEAIIGDIVKSYIGGTDNEAFRTEFMCEVIYNAKESVIPEFTPVVEKEIVANWPRPVFYDRYTVMDIGFEDWTALLFAYWDFDNGVLVIEDEFHMNGPEMTTPVLADNIRKKEESLWTNHLSGEFQPPYMRISDNNLILINDLQKDHGLTFLPTDKHNKDAYLGELRRMIQAHQIIINPKCKNLIAHLKGATWNKARSDFKKNKEAGHHYDYVAALMYLSRNIDKSRNPYPRGYKYQRIGSPGNVFISPRAEKETNQSYEKLAKQFERKSSFKLKK